MKKYLPLLLIPLLGKAALMIVLFILTAYILYYFGKIPLIDLDPSPFTAGIMLILFGLPAALLYVIITIPIIDLFTARFNQWTFINLTALLPAMLLANITNPMLAIFITVIVFNVIRIFISYFIGFKEAMLSSSINTVTNSILASFVLPFI